jgi:cytochrome P450 family 6
MAINLLVPKLSIFLNLKSIDNDVEDFMMSMVRDTMDYREKHNVSRRDFMQLLLQLRNGGKVSLDDDWDLTKTSKTDDKQVKSLTLEEVTAQAFVFFLAGFGEPRCSWCF